MADVARRAGTSTAVVSYTLNPGTRPVSDELRSRVLAAVEELGYRPDRYAQALRRGRRWGQIGLVVPDVTLPLYGTLVGHIEREGRARHQLVVVGNTGFDADVEAELVRGLIGAGIDGLVVASTVDGEQVARLSDAARLPVVWVHNHRGAAPSDVVGSDHRQAGRLAAEHLVDVHHRTRLAFVGGFTDDDVRTGDRETVRDRFTGFASVAGDSAIQIKTDLTLAGAYAAVTSHLAASSGLDGLVVGTYGQAAGALRAVTDAGLRVPEDVAVMAFDGDPRNSYAPIVLSTVQQHVDQIAAAALDRVLAGATEQKTSPSIAVFLSCSESCGCGLSP